MTSAASYRARAFAKLMGLTVKALHHYERVGLLKPRRTAAGHRIYSAKERERIEQIVALKFLGLPLKQIGSVLNGATGPLRTALRAQRQSLEARQQSLVRAIRILERVETSIEAGTAGPAIMRALAEEIAMQGIEPMQKYFDEASWPEARAHYSVWPSVEWRALLHDIHQAVTSEPASEHGRGLATRWQALIVQDAPQRNMLRAGYFKAWMHADEWPRALADRIPGLDLDAIGRFINEATWSALQMQQVPVDPRVRAPDRVAPTRFQLFADIAATEPLDPASDDGRRFVQRWRALVDAECAGDEEARAEMMAGFARRHRWPSGLRQTIAETYDMNVDTWTRVTDFIEAANTVHR